MSDTINKLEVGDEGDALQQSIVEFIFKKGDNALKLKVLCDRLLMKDN